MPTVGAQIAFQEADRLTPYAKNAHTHSDEQVAAIAQSMREWGWTMPLLIAQDCEGAVDGEIIAGHGRVMAAAQIYEAGGTIRMADGTAIPKGQIPYIIAKGWTDAQRRAYVIADNQLTMLGGWDEGVLRMELMDLREIGFNLALTGFDDTTLAGYLNVALNIESDPEVAPEVPAVPISRLGDVWVLGRHRLLCGDATKAADVASVLAGANPHLMVTDPPYGVEYDAAWRNRALAPSNRAVGRVASDDRADWREAWILFEGHVLYCWHGAMSVHVVADSLAASGFQLRSHLVWAKSHFAIGRGDYHGQHECCWYVVRKGSPSHWQGDRTQTTVWDIAKPQKSETGHSTQKPLECMRRPILNNSQPGDGIYDPFVGSGTTIIAAEMTGRRCYAIEINPGYVDVCVERWQNVTGQRAKLEADGASFASVKADRVVDA